VSQPLLQQGGSGEPLVPQHWARFRPVTGQAVASCFCVPQQSFMSQQAFPALQQAALSGWSQQALAVAQQRVFSTQQEAFEGFAEAEPAQTRRTTMAPKVAILLNIA
jgi:hypothetical protein